MTSDFAIWGYGLMAFLGVSWVLSLEVFEQLDCLRFNRESCTALHNPLVHSTFTSLAAGNPQIYWDIFLTMMLITIIIFVINHNNVLLLI